MQKTPSYIQMSGRGKKQSLEEIEEQNFIDQETEKVEKLDKLKNASYKLIEAYSSIVSLFESVNEYQCTVSELLTEDISNNLPQYPCEMSRDLVPMIHTQTMLTYLLNLKNYLYNGKCNIR